MIVYLYTFEGHKSHSDPLYNMRGKLGETDRAGKIGPDSTYSQRYARALKRIKQQDNAAVSEAPVILGVWYVNSDQKENVDDSLRDILIKDHDCKVTREDKRKNEWIVFPEGSDQNDLVDTAIQEFGNGELVDEAMTSVDLREVQQEIVASGAGTSKSLHIAGCGTGKTFAELNVLETNVPASDEVNIIVTSGRELANQVCEEIAHHTTVGQKYNDRNIILVHSGKSNMVDKQPTTDVDEIAASIRSSTKPVWIVSTYDSVRAAAYGIASADRTVNAKVLDEVHRATGVGSTKMTDAMRLKSKVQRAFTASYRTVKTKAA